MTESADDAIRSWCLAELAGWRARRLSYADVCEEYRKLNETRPWTFIFNIRDGVVSIAEKPADQPKHRESMHRAQLYLNLIQEAVTTHELDVETRFAIEVSDGGHRIDNAPIFVFQKPIGSDAVLLPDIDFLGGRAFYSGDDCDDNFAYDQKSTSAMFVGSTSGAINTEKIVRTLASPRLRAASYFRNNPRVQFLLPLIVQCDSKATEDLLRELGFGKEGRIPWKLQTMHKFIISMDGNGATCSRIVIALKSNSVLLKYNSPHILYYFSHLIPWKHYIPIGADADVDHVVQLELDDPGLFRFIADEGRAFAERYLTKAAVIQYTKELISFYADSFRREVAGAPMPAAPAVESVGAHADNDGGVPVIFECMGHIQNRGDVWAPGGTRLGEPGSRLKIEGIILLWTGDLAGLSYQAVLADGTLTDVAHCGELCGTRSRNTPIAGFRINLECDAAERLMCQYSATFTDGSKVGPIQAGQACQATTLAPLESMQIELRLRGARVGSTASE